MNVPSPIRAAHVRRWSLYPIAAALLLTALLAPAVATATTAILLDDATLAEDAVAVVISRVVDIETYADPSDGRIWSLIRLDVREVLKGPLFPGPLTLRQAGGTVGRRTSWIHGSPEFAQGEMALLFLEQDGDGTLRVAHLFQGKFTIARDDLTQEEFAYRELEPPGVTLLPPAGGRVAPRAHRAYRLDALRAVVNRHAGRAYRPPRPVARHPAVPPGAAAQTTETFGPVVLIDGCLTFCPRWFEPDEGLPILVRIDGRGAVENVEGSLAAARQALEAWTDVPGSSFRYADGGLVQEDAAGGFRRDGVTAIWFRDPANDMSRPINCRGTLAIGGVNALDVFQTRTVGGRTFVRTLEGDVVLNRGWAGCGIFENRTTLAEIITHELGHLLGLGHSLDQHSIMFARLRADDRGASLGAGDIAALRAIYPALSPLVERLYVHTLGRRPEISELLAWSSVLQEDCSVAGFAHVATGFFESTEFRSRQSQTLPHLVGVLYAALLDRPPDPPGSAAWTSVLLEARLMVATRGFVPSREFAAVRPNPADRTAVAAFVTGVYMELLGRVPGPGELSGWVEFIARSEDFDGLARAFVLTEEFLHRPLSAGDFVGALYRSLLNREPDGPGFATWEALLRSVLLDVITFGFLASAEFQAMPESACNR